MGRGKELNLKIDDYLNRDDYHKRPSSVHSLQKDPTNVCVEFGAKASVINIQVLIPWRDSYGAQFPDKVHKQKIFWMDVPAKDINPQKPHCRVAFAEMQLMNTAWKLPFCFYKSRNVNGPRSFEQALRPLVSKA